ncbi:hypothetical protein HNO92_004579 [Chromobacterium alkanivorans]|uniref:hypothetical protein n=1 Tax=Chromobacterium alkanivorans TaxID=1071719 RepID=UPI002169E3FF|nr:hypothetical protein [Chromobacterium alkanivorans]MCS3806892.1 hypothetical protein [Chromobacterium alkanivorans]MCS3821228.1 hypothetical protein [Chromobacterium alkanivorans]MCS3876228.1 hypothetical protein [Chromobacterium alkanivorans]
MTHIAQGSAPQLHWLQQRLASRGLPASAGASGLPSWLPRDWQGFYLPSGCWINVDPLHQASLPPRLRLCLEQGIPLLELDGAWQALGADFGFMLLLGAESAPPPDALALLDALAPLPAAWLRCGPAGSARYTRQVWEALLFMLRRQPPPCPSTPTAPDWETALREQWRLWEQLVRLSQRYLRERKLPEDNPTARRDFAEAPRQQEHYAASLAGLIVQADGCQQAWQQLWDDFAAQTPLRPKN